QLFTYKILSLPAELGLAVDRCIRDAIERSHLARVDAIVHGTTVGSNAVLEGKGALTGLVCTRGFRDLLEIRDGRRPAVNDIFWSPTPPLVPRRLRLEIAERMRADGVEHAPLDESDVHRAAEAFKAEGVEAVAVAFMHAYRSPEHEKRAARLL